MTPRDPIAFELFKNTLFSIADEMALTIFRTAYSGVLNPDTENRLVTAKVTMTIKRGDVFRHEQPGPGGWGDPLERETWRVVKDVRNGFVSPGSARTAYGVMLKPGTLEVDEPATATRRAELRAARGWTTPPVVS
jgi:N-methylhydantoinase B